jgi:UDP-N-acetylmuramoylalanine--D-glutamate ligase
MDKTVTDFSHKRVTVMGLGSFGGGIGAASFLAGQSARVTVTDLKSEHDLAESITALRGKGDIRFVLGSHKITDFTDTDLVVVSPAVPRNSEYVLAAREAGIPLRTEIGLFVERCPAPICGVTGSNGKTTTVSMLESILRNTGQPFHVGGNIGRSLLNELPEISPNDRIVLELSSFQIEWLDEMEWSPHVAAILNIMPNHLDRHGSFEEYRDVKGKILDHQHPGDIAVLLRDDSGSAGMERRAKGSILWAGTDLPGAGVTLEKGWITERTAAKTKNIFDSGKLLIPGKHNILNALAASACALAMGVVPAKIARGLSDFRGVPHRLQLVGEKEGVRFFNDSKATTPEAAEAGISAFDSRVIPILGGYDKGVSFDKMARGMAGKIRWAALIGITAPQIGKSLESAGMDSTVYNSLEDAFSACVHRAQPGDVVLLSPGCASYDMFNNYEERGEVFRKLVRKHIGEKTEDRSQKTE